MPLKNVVPRILKLRNCEQVDRVHFAIEEVFHDRTFLVILKPQTTSSIDYSHVVLKRQSTDFKALILLHVRSGSMYYIRKKTMIRKGKCFPN